jgi:hypothetical protein
MSTNDLEKQREYSKAWRERNPGYWKGWKKRPKERSRDLQRQWREKNPTRETFLNTKSRAKVHGTPFSIKFEEIFWPTLCPVFGTKLSYDKGYKGSKKIRDTQATLDRWDNSKGYILGNVFVISHKANRLKGNMDHDDMMALTGYMLRGPTSVDYCVEATETMGGYLLPEGAV